MMSSSCADSATFMQLHAHMLIHSILQSQYGQLHAHGELYSNESCVSYCICISVKTHVRCRR